MSGRIILLTEALPQALGEISSRAIEYFKNSTYPLYYIDRRHITKHTHAGSSFALEFNGIIHIITANHVIENIPKYSFGRTFLGLINDLSINLDLKTLEQTRIYRSLEHDIAAIRVSSSVADRIRAQGFAKSNEIALKRDGIENHCYLCLGYPHSKNRKQDLKNRSLEMQPVAYTTHYQLSCLSKNRSGIDEKHHLALARSVKFSIDPLGKRKEAYGFRGMSGAPVIDLGALGDYANIGCTESLHPKILSIITEYNKDYETIKSVKIDRAIDLINHGHIKT